MKSSTASLFSAALLATLCVLGVGCSDDPTPATDAGTVFDVPTDLGGDVAADHAVADTGTDVPTDVTRDAGSDVPASDVPASDGGEVLAARCSATGGTVVSGLCCLASGDFPNSCGIGGCGCAPASSHTIQRCTCPTGQCFNPATGCGANAR